VPPKCLEDYWRRAAEFCDAQHSSLALRQALHSLTGNLETIGDAGKGMPTVDRVIGCASRFVISHLLPEKDPAKMGTRDLLHFQPRSIEPLLPLLSLLSIVVSKCGLVRRFSRKNGHAHWSRSQEACPAALSRREPSFNRVQRQHRRGGLYVGIWVTWSVVSSPRGGLD
jgi:hypothetical protein